MHGIPGKTGVGATGDPNARGNISQNTSSSSVGLPGQGGSRGGVGGLQGQGVLASLHSQSQPQTQAQAAPVSKPDPTAELVTQVSLEEF